MSRQSVLSLVRNVIAALTLVATAILSAHLLQPWTQHSPALLPLAAVALAAWISGYSVGVLAAVAAALGGEYLLHEPRGLNLSPDGLLRLAVFLGVALLVAQLARREDRAAAHARQARGHLQMITEALPVLIAYIDRDERYQVVNSAWTNWHGKTKAQVYGRTVREICGDEMYQSIRPHLQRVLSGEMVNYEQEFTFPDGRRRTVLATYVPEVDKDGTVKGFAAIVADVSERRRAEAALRASEEKFHLMADSAPVMIWIADPNKRSTWFNQPWLEFTGRTLEQELELDRADIIHPEDLERYRQLYEQAFDARESFKIEYRMRRHDGTYRWVLDDGRPLWGPEGEFTGFIGSCIDITERKQHEEEREYLLASERYARSEAERISRMKDQFLATLSHELRTPLNGILGWAQLLRGNAHDVEEVEQGLEVIERNARVQTQIISDLLDMSRIISGKLPLEIQPVDLMMLLHGCLQTVQHSADAKEIRIERHIAGDLGTIAGDGGRLQQVIWNLLSNAIKFTPRGGVVRLEAQRSAREVRISVIDSGHGIEPQFLPHIFERFSQADASTTRKHGGLGLGLSIAKSLVELHGGTIEAHSDGAGKGARFDLTLPVSSIECAPEPKLPAPQRGTVTEAMPPRLEGVRVLAIDDEPDARELLRRLLSEQGAQVQTASDAQEAINLLSRAPFDVLLSDIGMPDCDGYDLIRRIRSSGGIPNARIPAAAVTAFARSEDRTRALLSGYQGFVAKPFEPSELVAVVASLSGTFRPDGTRPQEAEQSTM